MFGLDTISALSTRFEPIVKQIGLNLVREIPVLDGLINGEKSDVLTGIVSNALGDRFARTFNRRSKGPRPNDQVLTDKEKKFADVVAEKIYAKYDEIEENLSADASKSPLDILTEASTGALKDVGAKLLDSTGTSVFSWITSTVKSILDKCVGVISFMFEATLYKGFGWLKNLLGLKNNKEVSKSNTAQTKADAACTDLSNAVSDTKIAHGPDDVISMMTEGLGEAPEEAVDFSSDKLLELAKIIAKINANDSVTNPENAELIEAASDEAHRVLGIRANLITNQFDAVGKLAELREEVLTSRPELRTTRSAPAA